VSVETIAGGRYRVERVLGEGAMAKVLLAHDAELGREVAVKLLDERLAADPSFRARFAREARVAAGLSHPNVVTVFDVGEDDGRPFIVMELVPGRTLEERLHRDGALRANDVLAIARQVCAGLEHAHANGLVHRDLKPGNLIERDDGTVKIADFGIARAVEGTELTEAGTVVGTAAYLAPEQAEAGTVTPATDLFALGAVLYELLTGSQPWKIDSLAELAARRDAPPPELPPATPLGLRTAIERSLMPDPEDRPSSAAEVARLLDERDGDADADATVVIPRAAPRHRRKSPSLAPLFAIVAGVVLLALAALGIALGIADNSPSTPDPPAQADVQPIPDGATPSEDARGLADWLRENAR
jgi:eukaryotic-like serine/threonine-protein kinase